MAPIQKLVLFSFLIGTISACTPPPSDNSLLGGQAAVMATISSFLQVVDEGGHAIPGAEILIGTQDGQPFSGNRLRTDADGRVATPSGWHNTQDVTIEAPGFVRLTQLREQAGAHVYRLRRELKPATVLSGKTSGFGLLKTDGVLDVSLVFAALKRTDLPTLDLTRLLSPDVDKQSVYGQEIEMPSNLSIPSQTESVLLLVPVSLNKPRYRVALDGDGFATKTVAAVAAQFDFKGMISDLQDGKSFFDLINRLKFKSYSVRSIAISPAAAPVMLDLPIAEVPLKSSIVVQTGDVPTGHAVIATALTDHSGDLIVTDVKRLMANEKKNLLTSYGGASTWVVRTLKKYEPTRVNFAGYDYDELSSIVLPANQTPSEDFLPNVSAVETRGRSLILRPPQVSSGFVRTNTKVTLSRIEILSRDSIDLVAKMPIWEFVADGFISQIDLPILAKDPWAVKGRYRWELQFSATPAGSEMPTHLSRNSIDFIYD